MLKFRNLDDVVVHGAVIIGSHQTLNDNDIKQLVKHNNVAGAYGRHWKYNDGQSYQDSSIVVQYGPHASDHITFVGRRGLNECIEFLSREFPTTH